MYLDLYRPFQLLFLCDLDLYRPFQLLLLCHLPRSLPPFPITLPL